MSLIQFFSILNGSFFKTVSVYFYNNNFVTVFHAVVSIHFILIVRFDSKFVTGVGKSKKKNL